MTLPRIRSIGSTTFRLPDGNEIFVTNKYDILTGPEEWLASVGLASLGKAMRDSDEESTDRLYISADSPDRFDARYPGNLDDVCLRRSPNESRVGLAFAVERDVDEEGADVQQELTGLLAPLIARHGGSNLAVDREREDPAWFTVSFDISSRGRTVAEGLSIGHEAEALVHASRGGRLSLTSAADLVRTGTGSVLIGQPEGRWFDGKGAPYQLGTDEQKWELAKDVASFANSEEGGLIFIGARTRRRQDGDVVQSVTDFELSLFNAAQYRGLIASRVHSQIERLEIRTVPTQGSRGTAYIYVPRQRPEVKPFVTKGVVVGGGIRTTHISIPVRDGEDTRFAGAAEVHAHIQAGRAALQGQ